MIKPGEVLSIIRNLTVAPQANLFRRETVALVIALTVHDPSVKMLKWLLRDSGMWATLDIVGTYPIK